MKFIQKHRQETIAVLIIAIFWIGVGVKDEIGYTTPTLVDISQIIEEGEATPTPTPSDDMAPLPTS